MSLQAISSSGPSGQPSLNTDTSRTAEKKGDDLPYTRSTLQSADADAPGLNLGDPLAFLRRELAPNNQFFQALGMEQTLNLPEGTYVGPSKDGKPHGRGVLTYHSNDEKGRRKYDGEFFQGKRQGSGVLTWVNGNRYDGEWHNDLFNGAGHWSSSKCTYKGNFVDGKFHGNGVRVDADGTRWEGSFENDRVHGKAKRTSADGTVIYAGNYVEGFQSGYGELTGPGLNYKGQWVKGLYEGDGTLVYGNFQKSGVFKKGEFWEGPVHNLTTGTVIYTFREGKQDTKCVIL